MKTLIQTCLLALGLLGLPVFALDAPADQQRLLPLEGGRNFRDLGGYPTEDGRQVRWGVLYRSGTLYALTAEDYALLDQRGIAVIADLRSNEERAAEPTVWQAGEVELLSWSYSQGDVLGRMRAIFTGEDLTPDEVKQVMLAFYRELPAQQASHYTVVFDHLADNHLPLLMHCSAGKDRTGLGMALILSALGVPREVILEDYAMSGKYQQIPLLKDRGHVVGEGGPHAAMGSIPGELLAPLLASDPAYLEAAFAAIEAEHGSVMAYIRDELQVTDAELERLRAHLLEP